LDKRLKQAVPLLFLVVCLGVSAAAHLFGQDCQTHGIIYYRGDPVRSGLPLEAFIADQRVFKGETGDGEYTMSIPSDDPETKEKEGWAEGDTITVKVDGITAVPLFEAFPGIRQQNLHVPTLDVETTTWGKIKALFK
jgi:hypothetical protein